MNNVNLVTIFITGLLTGGLTCMAVQGGLLAATIAQSTERQLKEKVKSGHALPILAFLTTKLIAYTLLGFLLGWFGSVFQLSITTKVILQIAVAIFMIGTALNIFEVHPLFRYFVIQPPRFLTKMIRKESKSNHIYAPALLGAFTIFIPCGTTQAFMALAIASSNPLLGAAILFSFILGTSPIFFILGYFTTKLGDIFQQQFMRLAAAAIIILALFNLNNAIALSGSSFTAENIAKGFWCTLSWCSSEQAGVAVQNASITIQASGYSPNEITVKAGSRISLSLHNQGGGGCTQAFTIPSLNIQKVVPVGQSDTVSFAVPNKQGDIPFMCSMGMYRGTIHVI